MQREVSFGVFQGFVHHRSGQAQSTILTEDRTDSLTGFDAVGRGVLEADLLEDTVDISDNGPEVLIGKRVIATTALAWSHRLHGVFQWRTALRMPRLPASRTSRHRRSPLKLASVHSVVVLFEPKNSTRNTRKSGRAPAENGSRVPDFYDSD